MPRMPTCGAFRIGVESSEPKMPPLVMVNVPPRRSSRVSCVVARLLGETAICCSISAKRHPVGVAHHRHDQPLLRADGDADVVVVLEHHLVALNLGVQPRKRLERADDRLGEERHEAQADAVALLEGVAPPLAHLHDRRSCRPR